MFDASNARARAEPVLKRCHICLEELRLGWLLDAAFLVVSGTFALHSQIPGLQNLQERKHPIPRLLMRSIKRRSCPTQAESWGWAWKKAPNRNALGLAKPAEILTYENKLRKEIHITTWKAGGTSLFNLVGSKAVERTAHRMECPMAKILGLTR